VNKEDQMYDHSDTYKLMKSKWEQIWKEEQILLKNQMKEENDKLQEVQLNEKQ
jgi:hypothetical protein